MENAKELVRRFYTDCLTVGGADAASIMNELLADDFQSINAGDTKSKAQLTGQVQHFRKLIPDLKWTPEEILQDGDKVIVRSIATGTPNGDFMGVPCNGSKSFRIMTIDIHTVEGRKVKRVHHLEEWTTALKQLRS